MTVTYSEYFDKKLNQVVLLGSHDAGITQGNANTKTQTGGIRAQAEAGARFFDVRIAAFNDPTGSVSMRAYHDETKIKARYLGTKQVRVGPVGQAGSTRAAPGMKVHATVMGAKGQGLYQMLKDARQFVTNGEGTTEFLMLKFDKSTNWPLIAQACLDVLQENDVIFNDLPDDKCLNECTLRELRGRVVVLFTKDGWDACGIDQGQRRGRGILKWQNLYKSTANEPGAYTDDFPGLQYYGKGGVSRSAKGDSGKIAQNADIQTALRRGEGSYKVKTGGVELGGKKFFQRTIQKGHHDGVNPSVVGLLYWTTTGVSRRGIEARNNKMWTDGKQQLLVQATGLAVERMPSNVDPTSGSGAGVVKRFMPNIIMVDYVDQQKGEMVKALNTQSATGLQAAIEEI